MVLPPSIPSQPLVRTNGLPSSLDRLARRPDSMLGCPSVTPPLNTSNNSSIDRVSSNHSHGLSARVRPSALAKDPSTHSTCGSRVHDMEKISIDLTQSEHQRREWTSVVVKVCKSQANNTSKAEKVIEKMVPPGSSAKPFSNFRKLRTTKRTQKQPKKHEPSSQSYDKSESRDVFGELQQVKSVPSAIITKDYHLFGEEKSRLEELFPRSNSVSGRLVRFQVDDADMVPDATSISLDSTISTLSSLKSKRSASSSKRSLDISNHRCPRTKNVPKKKTIKRFWSPEELKEVRESAKKQVQKFQAKHAATVRQVDQLFGDFCSLNNKKDEQEFGEDEEKEEMLRAFLEDWAAFGLRGLEEGVTAHRMFLEDRLLSIASVLTYQERLKAQERNQRMFSLYSSTTLEDVATLERRAELLRARSESTSHRARMFAMYMALGDALFVANEDQSISF